MYYVVVLNEGLLVHFFAFPRGKTTALNVKLSMRENKFIFHAFLWKSSHINVHYQANILEISTNSPFLFLFFIRIKF